MLEVKSTVETLLTEKEELEQKVSQLTKKNDALIEKVKTFHSLNETLTTELNTLQSSHQTEIANLQKQKETDKLTCQKNIELLEKEKEDLKNEVMSLKTKLEKVDKLQRELDFLQSCTRTLRKEYSIETKQGETISKEVLRLLKEKENLSQQILKLSQEKENLKEKIDVFVTENTNLKKQLNEVHVQQHSIRSLASPSSQIPDHPYLNLKSIPLQQELKEFRQKLESELLQHLDGLNSKFQELFSKHSDLILNYRMKLESMLEQLSNLNRTKKSVDLLTHSVKDELLHTYIASEQHYHPTLSSFRTGLELLQKFILALLQLMISFERNKDPHLEEWTQLNRLYSKLESFTLTPSTSSRLTVEQKNYMESIEQERSQLLARAMMAEKRLEALEKSIAH